MSRAPVPHGPSSRSVSIGNEDTAVLLVQSQSESVDIARTAALVAFAVSRDPQSV